MSSDWPLVGRARELARIQDVLGSGGHVVLTGPAGVGTTRLAREATDALGDAGFATEWVIGTGAAAKIPFGAAAPLLPPPTAPIPPIEPDVDAMASIRGAIMARASGRGLVLAVDDAQCLDDATATLVWQLATTTDARMVVTLRSGEPPPEAVAALWHDGLAERIDLEPLSDTEVHDLLTEALGGPVDERSASELIRGAEGNGLLLTELVREAQAASALRFEHGRWCLTGALPTGTRLVDVVEARTEGVTGASRALLQYLALGEPLPRSVLAALVGHEVLDQASHLGLVDVDHDRRRAAVRLSHPLYGEVVRSAMPAFLVRTRSRTLVEAYGSTPLRRSDDIVRFASWNLDAAVGAAPDLLLRAANRSMEGADLLAAERFAAAAVDLLTPTPDPTTGDGPGRPEGSDPDADLVERHTRAILVLAGVLGAQARFDDAAAVLDRIRPGAPAALAAAAVELRSLGRFLGADDQAPAQATEALVLLEEVEERFQDVPARMSLRIARAHLLTELHRPIESIELLDRTATPTLELEHRWLARRAPALASTGRLDEAERAITRARALPPTDLAPAPSGWIPRTTVMIATGRSELASLEARLRGTLDQATSLRDRSGRRVAAALLGSCLLDQGRVTEAIELLVIGTEGPGRPDHAGLRLVALVKLACARARAGDPTSARSILDHAERTVSPPARLREPMVALGGALTASTRGMRRQRREALRAGLIRCHASGSHVLEVDLALAACQIGAPELAAEFTGDLRTKVDGPMPRLAHDWAGAATAGDADRLEAVGKDLEALGRLLQAADATAAAADIHEDAGRSARAGAARARDRHLLDRCPGADPAFLRRSGGPAPLTAREVEIARLAGAGLASVEIARCLHISTDTVDAQLGRVYGLLDVREPAELRNHPQLAPREAPTRPPRLIAAGRARRSGR